MANCAKCGDCCKSIFIGSSYEAIMGDDVQTPPEGYKARDSAYEETWKAWDEYLTIPVRDRLFMQAHWHPILNEDGSQFAIDNGNGLRHGYTCDAYDPPSKLCTMQEDKPPICADYPYYDNSPGYENKTPDKHQPRCSFWWDIPREQWPEGIDPLPSPPNE